MVSKNTIAIALCAVILVAAAGIIATTFSSGITGAIAGTAGVTISSTVSISLPTSSIDFGTMTIGASESTSDGSPVPFVVQNDGNVKVDVNISATDLFTNASNPSSNYQFAVNTTGEGTCYNASASVTSWTDMPSTSTLAIGQLNFPSSCDSSQVEIGITVPSEEPPGAKSSTVTFTASQS